MVRRRLVLLVCIVLVLGLLSLAGACTPQEATPGVPEDSSAQKIQVSLYTTAMGSFGYTTGLTISNIINENSDHLSVIFAEGPGTWGNIQALATDQRIRENSIVKGGESAFFKAIKGFEPLEEPFPSLRVVFQDVTPPYVLVTFDPEIKTLKDVQGKHISVGATGYACNEYYKAALDALGIGDKVRISNMDFNESKSAMLDGLLDVGVAGPLPISPNELKPNAALMELMASGKELYFVDVPVEVVEPVAKALGIPWTLYTIPAMSIDGVKPDRDVHSYAQWCGYYADASVDELAVYEFTKWTYEKCEEKIWPVSDDARAINRKNMPFYGDQPLDMIHPGALRYFEEHGIEVRNNL